MLTYGETRTTILLPCADEFPNKPDASKTDESSDNEELNDLTIYSDNDVPFLARYGYDYLQIVSGPLLPLYYVGQFNPRYHDKGFWEFICTHVLRPPF